MITDEGLGQLDGYLWPHGSRRDIWMIVDAARDKRIYGMLLSHFYSRHICLYSGNFPQELEAAAPYLVRLDYDDEETRRFIRQAWGHSWGVFLKCDTRMETIRRHLRTLLIVRAEDGRRLLFRYYDPRILRDYLPTCTTDELRTVFGPIDRFFVEEKSVDAVLECRLNDAELVVRRLSLDRPAGNQES